MPSTLFIKRTLLFAVVVMLLASCDVVRVLAKVSNENAVYQQWTNQQGKQVVFIPMVHIGKPAFYENVRKSVTSLKQQGYILFYEIVSREVPDSALTPTMVANYIDYPAFPIIPQDSLAKLIYLLKFRKIAGGYLPGLSTYDAIVDQQPILSSLTAQPRETLLGGSETDKNADVSFFQLVRQYENEKGEIVLNEEDFATPLNKSVPAIAGFSDINHLIIDFRDDHLARSIHASDSSKIVVMFGLAHMKGTFDKLKGLDASWQITKRSRNIFR